VNTIIFGNKIGATVITDIFQPPTEHVPTLPDLTPQAHLELQSSLLSLPKGWYNWIDSMIQLCKLESASQSHIARISRCNVFAQDISWSVFVLTETMHRFFSLIPDHLDHNSVKELTSVLDLANVCHGYPNVNMANAHGGVFKDKNGQARLIAHSHISRRGVPLNHKNCKMFNTDTDTNVQSYAPT
jgi:hypothetical protein